MLNYGCGNVVKEDAKDVEAFAKKFAKEFAKEFRQIQFGELDEMNLKTEKMKHILMLLTILVSLTFVSCGHDVRKNDEKIRIILETDIGNDVDDALAMDMLHKYIDAGKIDVLAIMINKNGEAPAEFTDIVDTWYGHHDIPIGIVRNGADCETDAVNYAKIVCNLKTAEGQPLFERSMSSYSDLPDAHSLYRKILSEQPDSSVTIVSIGFSTNLARLMETSADDYSPLTGMELISSKVNCLVTMAGCFNDAVLHEYNVVTDIPAAKKVFESWPGTVVTSPFELGIKILYPAHSIENDFGWTANHPVVEAYKSYLPMPYDRPTWDMTSLLYAVEGDGMFSLSPAGRITVDENGATLFSEDPSGNRYYLKTDEAQDSVIRDCFVEMISAAPEARRSVN